MEFYSTRRHWKYARKAGQETSPSLSPTLSSWINIISISRIKRRLWLHLEQEAWLLSSPSSSSSLSTWGNGHRHRNRNRCIKYFWCFRDKLQWNTNLQIQIDGAVASSNTAGILAVCGVEFSQGWGRVLSLAGASEISEVCVLKIRKLRDCIRKERHKNCWNVEIGLRLSWILNDERSEVWKGAVN